MCVYVLSVYCGLFCVVCVSVVCVCSLCVCVIFLCGWVYVCVCVCVCSLSVGGSVCGSVGLYISVPYNLVESLKCYTLHYLKDVIF